MIHHWQRMAAIVLLSVLGAGVLYVLIQVVGSDGELTKEDAGWATAGFLSLREIISKMEKIALGTPDVPPMGE